MDERRWPWLATAVLMMGAGLAAGSATYLHWLPCRGSLLSGSVLHAYRYGADFSDACLGRMDSGLPFPYPPEPSQQAPWASELGVVAMALTGTAWLVLTTGMRWRLRTRAVAALPGLATVALAATSASLVADPGRSAGDHGPQWLLLAPEATMVMAFAAIITWQPEVTERSWARLVVTAWGATVFGLAHLVSEHALMVALSDASWDTPTLTGGVTAATLVAAGILTLSLRPRTGDVPATTVGVSEGCSVGPGARG